MTIANDDLILVERSGTKYKESYEDRSNIGMDDLILVERSGTKYKCTYGDWIGYVPVSATNYHSNNVMTPLTVTTGSGGDSTAAYQIISKKVEVTGSGTSATGRFYFGCRVQGTSYFNDLCIGHLQVLASPTTFRTDSTYSNGYDWTFHTSGTYGYSNWQTTYNGNNSTTTNPSSYLYASVGTSYNGRRWMIGSGTSSSNTGAADGIYSPSVYSGNGGSIIPDSGTIAQSSNTSFIFSETSWPTATNNIIWLRSPQITVHNDDWLRIAYLAAFPASGGGQSQNQFYIRWA